MCAVAGTKPFQAGKTNKQHIYVFRYLHMNICMCIYVYMCVYMRICCVYMYMSTYMYMYIHMHMRYVRLSALTRGPRHEGTYNNHESPVLEQAKPSGRCLARRPSLSLDHAAKRASKHTAQRCYRTALAFPSCTLRGRGVLPNKDQMTRYIGGVGPPASLQTPFSYTRKRLSPNGSRLPTWPM